MAPKIWSKVAETIKMTSSLESFKTKIHKWKPEFNLYNIFAPCWFC